MKYQYEFIADRTVDSVISQLRKHGIALVPNYLPTDLLPKLNSEFEAILERRSQSVRAQIKHPGNRDGKVAIFDPWHQAALSEYQNIAQAFRDDFMRQITHAYYSPHDYRFNDEVFITHELPDVTPTLPWHFDRVQALKFWFNLTDTTAKDGAFEYCPGTHWEGRYRAGYHMSQGVGVQDIPNDIDETFIRNPVTLEINAGDLLIFDADGIHRSSQVFEGGEQRVLRAHSHPAAGRSYGDKKFSPGWWLTGPLNLNRWFGKHASRILGEKIQDGTVNRENQPLTKKVDH